MVLDLLHVPITGWKSMAKIHIVQKKTFSVICRNVRAQSQEIDLNYAWEIRELKKFIVKNLK